RPEQHDRQRTIYRPRHYRRTPCRSASCASPIPQSSPRSAPGEPASGRPSIPPHDRIFLGAERTLDRISELVQVVSEQPAVIPLLMSLCAGRVRVFTPPLVIAEG